MSTLVAALNVQTVVDGVGIGAIYALMAVGIGLVFGVLRLVNFAYGQLVMAGAFALALASEWEWPAWAGIVLCFAVVVGLTMIMERLVFRPLRTQSPAVMLVATFAVAFLLQAIALLWFGALGKPATALVSSTAPCRSATWTCAGSRSSRSSSRSSRCCSSPRCSNARASVYMRAAALDFHTARMLGVRANRVIGTAVPLRAAGRHGRGAPDRAEPARDAGIRVQRDDRRAGGRRARRDEQARLGDARRLRDRLRVGRARRRVADRPEPVPPSVLFGLVILVLLIRPSGRARRRRGV